MSEPLRLKGVSQVFDAGTTRQVRALDNVDLVVGADDFVVIVGANGSGKSSLLKAIYSGQLTAGQVLLNGRDIIRLPDCRRASVVSLINQNPEEGTADELSIRENLALASLRQRRAGLRRALSDDFSHEDERIIGVIGDELGGRLGAPASSLSGGERQVLCVLMALVGRPEILLCDEPTASIDVARGRTIEHLADDFCKRLRIPVLWITHDPEQAIRLGNRLLVLSKGKISQDFAGERKEAMTAEQVGDMIRDSRVGAASSAG